MKKISFNNTHTRTIKPSIRMFFLFIVENTFVIIT